MKTLHEDLRSALIDLEAAMRQYGLWGEQPPLPEAFRSEQPFCLDTMALNEWLQWVFVQRIYFLMDEQQGLPERCQIAPMAEEWFKLQSMSGKEVIGAIRLIDDLLNAPR